MKEPATRWLAFAWGLAEATVFFIVPDVLLTRLALKDFRSAWIASLWALGGALLGGTALYLVARHGIAPFLPDAFDRLPGISTGLVERTGIALTPFTAVEYREVLALSHLKALM